MLVMRRRKGNNGGRSSRHGTVARDVQGVTSWHFRSGSADVTRSPPACFTWVHRLSFPVARTRLFLFRPRRTAAAVAASATSRLLVARSDHVIFGIGNARRETLSAGDSRSIGDDL